MTLSQALPLQFEALASLPGVVGAVLVVLVVVLVARVLLKLAWRVAIVALVVALGLWFMGLFGPLAGLVGV